MDKRATEVVADLIFSISIIQHSKNLLTLSLLYQTQLLG